MSHYERVYFDDLMNDEALRLVSDGAWKLWIQMFLYMGTKSPVRGELRLANGSPAGVLQLSRILSTEPRKLRRCIAELEMHRVFSRNEEGVIVCRRQLREAEASKKKDETRAPDAPVGVEVVSRSDEVSAPGSASENPETTHAPPRARTRARWHLVSGSSDLISEEGVQREGATLSQTTPDDFITADAVGIDWVREAWNEQRPAWLPECVELQRTEKQNIARIIAADMAHRKRAWWVTWIARTRSAKFLTSKVSGAATLGWFVEDEDRIARLLRGEYDNPAKDARGNSEPTIEYKKHNKPKAEPAR